MKGGLQQAHQVVSPFPAEGCRGKCPLTTLSGQQDRVGWGGARPPPSHPTHRSWGSRPRSLQQGPAQTGRGRHIPLLRPPPCRGSHPPPGRPARTPACSKLSSGPLLPPAVAAPNAAAGGLPEGLNTSEPPTLAHTHTHTQRPCRACLTSVD